MARKSRWQQFSENFNSTYSTLNGAFEDFETAKVMKQDFNDDAGNALAGTELDRRRYQALADIKTKYGDAEGGLTLRSNAEVLAGQTMSNDIMTATKEDQIYQQGAGASGLLRAQINRANRPAASRPRSITSTEAKIAEQSRLQGIIAGVPRGGSSAPAPAETFPVGTPAGGSGAGSGGGGVAQSLTAQSASNSVAGGAAADTLEPIASGGLSFGALAKAPQGKANATTGSVSTGEEVPVFDSDPVGQEWGVRVHTALTNAGEVKAAEEWRKSYMPPERYAILQQGLDMLVNAQEAYRRDGPTGFAQMWNDYNGTDLEADVFLDNDGNYVLQEFRLGKDGKRTDTRTVAKGTSEAEFRINIENVFKDPVTAMEASKSYYDTMKAKAEAYAKENPPKARESPEEFVMRVLTEPTTKDLNNVAVAAMIANTLDIDVEDAEVMVDGLKMQIEDQETRDLVASQALAVNRTGGPYQPAPAPGEPVRPSAVQQNGFEDPTPPRGLTQPGPAQPASDSGYGLSGQQPQLPALDITPAAARQELQVITDLVRQAQRQKMGQNDGTAQNMPVFNSDAELRQLMLRKSQLEQALRNTAPLNGLRN